LPERPEWRAAATASLRPQGIDYIVLAPQDLLNADFDANARAWSVTEEFQAKGWRVLKIDPE
jgi:hypothetical protein